MIRVSCWIMVDHAYLVDLDHRWPRRHLRCFCSRPYSSQSSVIYSQAITKLWVVVRVTNRRALWAYLYFRERWRRWKSRRARWRHPSSTRSGRHVDVWEAADTIPLESPTYIRRRSSTAWGAKALLFLLILRPPQDSWTFQTLLLVTKEYTQAVMYCSSPTITSLVYSFLSSTPSLSGRSSLGPLVATIEKSGRDKVHKPGSRGLVRNYQTLICESVR